MIRLRAFFVFFILGHVGVASVSAGVCRAELEKLLCTQLTGCVRSALASSKHPIRMLSNEEAINEFEDMVWAVQTQRDDVYTPEGGYPEFPVAISLQNTNVGRIHSNRVPIGRGGVYRQDSELREVSERVEGLGRFFFHESRSRVAFKLKGKEAIEPFILEALEQSKIPNPAYRLPATTEMVYPEEPNPVTGRSSAFRKWVEITAFSGLTVSPTLAFPVFMIAALARDVPVALLAAGTAMAHYVVSFAIRWVLIDSSWQMRYEFENVLPAFQHRFILEDIQEFLRDKDREKASSEPGKKYHYFYGITSEEGQHFDFLFYEENGVPSLVVFSSI